MGPGKGTVVFVVTVVVSGTVLVAVSIEVAWNEVIVVIVSVSWGAALVVVMVTCLYLVWMIALGVVVVVVVE